MTTKNGMPYRQLGRTGKMVSLIGLGGYHLGRMEDEQESIKIVRRALDSGVNFLDNSWDYNGGQSELRVGKALRDGYRQKAFVMTKIDGRTKIAAARQIDESLQRLQVDTIDLLQFHEIIRFDDPDRVFDANGALAAAVEAKQAGKIRYLGFTGHKSPEIHLKMLDAAFAHGVIFDTVQMPLNLMDAHYDSFEKKVLPVLNEHDIGVLAMKPMGDHTIVLHGLAEPIECLHYAMNLPVSVVITGCDSPAILDQALQAARTFQPLSPEQVGLLLAKTEKAGLSGACELYKTAKVHDSTDLNPQWLR